MGANILGFNGVVLSMVGDAPVDSKKPTMISSILRVCWLGLKDAHRGRFCARAFIE